MVRRNNEPISGVDKAKVRVFFAEVEGNNESVQEALKTMVSAMSRPLRVISEPKANCCRKLMLKKARKRSTKGKKLRRSAKSLRFRTPGSLVVPERRLIATPG